VSKWRQRFAKARLDGLQDAPRSGKPKTYDDKTEKRMLALLDNKPPDGYSQWNGRLLRHWAMSVTIRFGVYYASSTFNCSGGEVGVS
jgi:transposase